MVKFSISQCRFCLSDIKKNDDIDIFTAEIDDMRINRFVYKVYELNLDPGLGKIICKECHQKVEDFVEFGKQIAEVDKSIRKEVEKLCPDYLKQLQVTDPLSLDLVQVKVEFSEDYRDNFLPEEKEISDIESISSEDSDAVSFIKKN